MRKIKDKQNRYALCYASNELRKNKEILYFYKNYLTKHQKIFKEYELLVKY